jgi:hypothetical protein
MSTHPPRAASAASGVSATSGMESRGSQLNNGSPPDVDPSSGPSPLLDGVYPHHQTPQSTSAPGGGAYASVPPQAYLPPITSSPPPHTPQYVPPPQHAMAPDPIHSAQMGMPSGAVPGMMGGPWQAGVAWRGPQPIHQPFRQPLPNGHPAGPGMQHQLPPNPVEAYNQRMGGAPGTGPAPQASLLQQAIMGNGGRPSSAHGEGRDRRRRDRDEDRADKERDGEEEVISTIFVVGFPDDMQVSRGKVADSGMLTRDFRNASSRTSSPSHPGSKQRRSSSHLGRTEDENRPPPCLRNSLNWQRISKPPKRRRPSTASRSTLRLSRMPSPLSKWPAPLRPRRPPRHLPLCPSLLRLPRDRSLVDRPCPLSRPDAKRSGSRGSRPAQMPSQRANTCKVAKSTRLPARRSRLRWPRRTYTRSGRHRERSWSGCSFVRDV